MGIAENKRIVQSFYEAGNRGDLEAAVALLADEVRWTVTGTTKFSGAYAGKQDLVTRLVAPLFTQLKAGINGTIQNLIAEGDFVAAQVSGHAETKDGRAYNNTYCFVFRFRDGKVAEVTEYLDTELVTAVFGK
jgi:ketosteroid isomerase-like protein